MSIATTVPQRSQGMSLGSETVNPRNRMPETSASGSVGAPLDESEGATRQRCPPTGYPHLFRFYLELVTLRAKEVTVFCA